MEVVDPVVLQSIWQYAATGHTGNQHRCGQSGKFAGVVLVEIPSPGTNAHEQDDFLDALAAYCRAIRGELDQLQVSTVTVYAVPGIPSGFVAESLLQKDIVVIVPGLAGNYPGILTMQATVSQVQRLVCIASEGSLGLTTVILVDAAVNRRVVTALTPTPWHTALFHLDCRGSLAICAETNVHFR